ncbi:MAG: hypothetical protein QXI93_02285 [Candidatus Methanomethylicia archaeon]
MVLREVWRDFESYIGEKWFRFVGVMLVLSRKFVGFLRLIGSGFVVFNNKHVVKAFLQIWMGIFALFLGIFMVRIVPAMGGIIAYMGTYSILAEFACVGIFYWLFMKGINNLRVADISEGEKETVVKMNSDISAYCMKCKKKVIISDAKEIVLTMITKGLALNLNY